MLFYASNKPLLEKCSPY